MLMILTNDGNKPLNGWRDALRKISDTQVTIGGLYDQPRKQNAIREKLADMIDVIHPLFIDAWVSSFPLNTPVPHVNWVDICHLLKRLRDNHEWASVTWDTILSEMIQKLAFQGIECPIALAHLVDNMVKRPTMSYLTWWKEVSVECDRMGIRDEDKDMPDWWSMYDSGMTPFESVKNAIENP